jgi:hypothetical protein
VNRVLYCPTIQENANRKCQGSGDGQFRRYAILCCDIQACFSLSDNVSVRISAQIPDSKKHSNSNGNVGKTHFAEIEMILPGIYKRVRGEEEVNDSVSKGHINGQRSHDGGEDEKLHGPNKGDLEEFDVPDASIELRPKIKVSSLLA